MDGGAQRLCALNCPSACPAEFLTVCASCWCKTSGLAVIAGADRGGGFGLFVFQGPETRPTDLILLGACPPFALALNGGHCKMDILVD